MCPDFLSQMRIYTKRHATMKSSNRSLGSITKPNVFSSSRYSLGKKAAINQLCPCQSFVGAHNFCSLRRFGLARK